MMMRFRVPRALLQFPHSASNLGPAAQRQYILTSPALQHEVFAIIPQTLGLSLKRLPSRCYITHLQTMPRTALTPSPPTMYIDNTSTRSPLQKFHDYILRCKLRLGLNTITDIQNLEGRIIRTWAISQEDNRLVRPRPPTQC